MSNDERKKSNDSSRKAKRTTKKKDTYKLRERKRRNTQPNLLHQSSILSFYSCRYFSLDQSCPLPILPSKRSVLLLSPGRAHRTLAVVRLLASPSIAIQTLKSLDLGRAAHHKGRLGSDDIGRWPSQGENTLQQDLEGAGGDAGGRSSDLCGQPVQRR
jgi:hypothetical protein